MSGLWLSFFPICSSPPPSNTVAIKIVTVVSLPRPQRVSLPASIFPQKIHCFVSNITKQILMLVVLLPRRFRDQSKIHSVRRCYCRNGGGGEMLYAVGNRVSHSEKTKLILGGAEMRRLIIILAKVAEQLAVVLPARQAAGKLSSETESLWRTCFGRRAFGGQLQIKEKPCVEPWNVSGHLGLGGVRGASVRRTKGERAT
jgi:hypothetical protein